MLSRFFVMDHERRPTSEELLRSKEYGALQTAAAQLRTLNESSDDHTAEPGQPMRRIQVA